LTNCKPVSFSRMTLHHGVSKYYLKEHSIKLFRTVNHYSEFTNNVTASDFTANSATMLMH